MQIINVDVEDELIFKSIKDVDTGTIRGISSVLKLPTGNLNNMLLNFNFANEQLSNEFNLVASFNINGENCIDVAIDKITVKEETYQHACYIPAEIFEKPCFFYFGLYGVSATEETIKQRLSLFPLKNLVYQGSYNPDSKSGIVPTPTIFEVYFAKIDNMTKDLTKFKTDTEKEIEDLIEDKISYYKQYKSIYTTTTENETTIPIGIEQYNSSTLLEVFINGLRLAETTDYIIDTETKTIALIKPLAKIGTQVYFSVYKSAIAQAKDYDLLKGEKGENGINGTDGLGVPAGGTTGQVLVKKTNADNDTEWIDPTGGQASGDTLPIGSIMPYPKATAPENWLICDGSAISRTDYSELFNAIGTTFGEGDGSTTFNLPNTKGRTIVGLDADDADFNTIGKTLGEKTHTLTVEEMPEHTHKFRAYTKLGNDEGTITYGERNGGSIISGNYGNAIQKEGSSQSHNNIQPSFIGVYIIKAKQSAGVVATVVDSLESTSATDALSAKQGRVLNEKINNLPKLIYSKVTTETDANGFDITGVTFEPNKNYQISYVGNMNGSDGSTLKNIFIEFNDVTPNVKRSIIFGSEAGQLKNSYSTDSLRLIRGWSGFGTMSNIDLIFKENYIRTIGKYSCTASTFDKSLNSTVNSIIGPFDEISKISITPEAGVTLATESIIKIYEMP